VFFLKKSLRKQHQINEEVDRKNIKSTAKIMKSDFDSQIFSDIMFPG
jgi:hypothetical protein